VKYRWQLATPQPLLAGKLAQDLGLPPLLAQCLLNRGYSEPEQIEPFLTPRLKQLKDPYLLPDMTAAVDRLWQARDAGESVVIFGDYDVDGVTSTTLLSEVLRQLGWKSSSYLPSRMDEGYGLSRAGVENCLETHQVDLLLAVDCGSTAVETIRWLRQRHVDVIVLDHHQVASPAPEAVALVNPQAAGKEEPDFRELCSVGLAFKLAHALVKHGRDMGLAEAVEYDLRPLLDLVALGTVADIVPLVRENRIFVAAGLQWLEKTQRPGLVALKKVAGVEGDVGVYEVGFQLGPRLNAAGRLETATDALKLLQAGSLTEAMPLAEHLDSENRNRQKIERSIFEEVQGAIESRFQPDHDLVIVEGRLLWHIGVVGIVASRILQQFYRPTLIIGGEGEEWRGSGRSIPGFDLAAALRECDDLLLRHGGHAMAAGLSIDPKNLDALRERLNSVAQRTLKPTDLEPPLRLDAEVGLSEIGLEGLAQLDRLRPTGQGNPAVQFCARGVSHARALRRMGKEQQHVKMWLTDGAITHEAVWWRAGDQSLPVGQFDLAFAPQINRYNGRTCVQLKVLDWRPS
jgi:single-stranded-DNA-specific exonuclease